MDKKKKTQLTKKEHFNLFCKVESEGFDYYMFQYGPDMDAIERLGFNRKKIEEACKLLKTLESKIYEAEEYADEYEDL